MCWNFMLCEHLEIAVIHEVHINATALLKAFMLKHALDVFRYMQFLTYLQTYSVQTGNLPWK